MINKEEGIVKKNITLKISQHGSTDIEDFSETIKNLRNRLNENSVTSLQYEDDEDDEDDDDYEEYLTNSYTDEVSFIEFAIINSFLHRCLNGKFNTSGVSVNGYGTTDSIGRIEFGGTFEITGSYWYRVVLDDDDNDYIFQTKMFVDGRGDLVNQFHLTSKKGIDNKKFIEIYKNMKSLAFNNSEYNGKCIKVKLKDGRFKGIEIIDIAESANELILNDTQLRYIKHFVSCVKRGGSVRILLNGEPGTGKTESIREISRQLIPNVTFIVPDFNHADDLTSIMESCEIFNNSVIIMDDIDLYLGSRDNGSYTRLLGQFLSFFDGVKKRKISLLASTNDKGLVDKAAERPGRFNVTLDYTFLNKEQIVKVCDIHLQEKWRVQEVYNALTGTIGGKKVNITGAFIANLAENIKEMSEDDENWSIDDTVTLIQETYKGFYSSQVEKEKKSMGFQTN